MTSAPPLARLPVEPRGAEGRLEQQVGALVEPLGQVLDRADPLPCRPDQLPRLPLRDLFRLVLRGDELGHLTSADVTVCGSPARPPRDIEVPLAATHLPAHPGAPLC